MNLNDPNRLSNRKPTFYSRERFLGLPSHATRFENPSSTASATATDDDDLIEDDVVFSNDNHNNDDEDSIEPSSSSSPIPNNNHHHKAFAFGLSDSSFGILAALPENDHPSPNGSHFFHHKPSASVAVSLSSSSSSSARLIPTIPKPPPDRTPSSSVKFPQSAPVNVPMFPTRRHCDFDDDVGQLAAEEERLPPHEIVARNWAQSPALACSVLEGVGRTLKGRDLRQVRNAVWRQTGFLD